MDIYTYIHHDHEEAQKLLSEIASLPEARHAERLRKFKPVKEALIAHNEAEETTFYAALEQHRRTQQDVKESKHEHHEAARLLEKLDDKDLAPSDWTRTFNAVNAALDKHIREEEGEVFAEAKTLIARQHAELLARQMDKLKNMKLGLLKHAS